MCEIPCFDMSSNQEQNFLNYGIYTITDDVEFNFPGTEIKFKKLSENAFLYQKNDLTEKIVEKNVPSASGSIQIEICPIRPLNYPAKRTDYVYLDFTTPVFLPSGSSVVLNALCQIEVGIFVIHDSTKDSLDWFDCNLSDSRFALYGPPDSGVLCKYSKSPIVSSDIDSDPYENASIQITIKNELSDGRSVRRIVFPATAFSLYYKDNKAKFDNASAILKKKLALELIDVSPEKIQTDWQKSTTYEVTSTVKHSQMGVD
ncbi:hypothetical protein AAA799B03_00456 [Marine Group I thaumarchaeote SCGC AAA799-B03]|uniref:DUF432 domain-containing protein n=4 Tax=Marine Group I TaxID=905826 RepID=A0A087S857_9ARCH|nr:hypothetical protein AAA799N04_00236 [Marine Group I thaumarchaeote SCGC AAA799-N04]KFM16003.1 hypothetical protein AAA799D11_00792 [Marine Group I thaumarchaeote SCGC AAA799-D11]KFM17740.1 hypothetical protein SCCGRSA3_01670 [Marine Group I thaumarchaeote SCGC RSA3]KFM21911.1 hypothetical protein AAA799B03_00456 [Marine Group I thaumarchaeote SCGC AAA799-B03]